MTHRSRRPLVAILCAVACAAVAAALPSPGAGYVRTEDRNGDGRPDVWRAYDRHGQLSEVAVDTNFDGRSDVHEYYEGGALVRRDLDRDFNDRVDLVEEFDPMTRKEVRSIEDVDDDGRADLLVLFQSGRPVFSKWVQPVTPPVAIVAAVRHVNASTRTGNDPLVPLEDPFRADLALRAVRVVADSGDYVGLSTSGGLPASGGDARSPLASSSGLALNGPGPAASTLLDPRSSRGPPVSPS